MKSVWSLAWHCIKRSKALPAAFCRFYIMRLPSRGLAFDRITYHSNVTQCLGGLGQQSWYLAVAEPSGSLEAWPQLADLQAFR